MKNMKLNKDFHKILLAIMGFIMCLIYTYLKFIRERLPRDIPFSLSLIRFSIILFTCFVLMYAIYVKLEKKKSAKSNIYRIVLNVVTQPLETFDDYLKTQTRFHIYYKNSLKNFIEKSKNSNIYFIIYNCSLFAKVTLVIAFIIDVYFLHKLSIIYELLPLSFIILLINYLMYSLKKFETHLIEDMSPLIEKISVEYSDYLISYHREYIMDVDPENEVDREMYLTLDNFVQFQMLVESERPDNLREEYFFGIILNEKNYSTEIVNLLEKELYGKIKLAVTTALLSYEYEKITDSSFYYKEYTTINLLIIMNYLLTWLYILIVSLHTLSIKELFYFLFTFLVNFHENLLF